MDGSEYTGEYFDDKPHGQGKLKYANINSIKAYIFGKTAKGMKENGRMESFTAKE